MTNSKTIVEKSVHKYCIGLCI